MRYGLNAYFVLWNNLNCNCIESIVGDSELVVPWAKLDRQVGWKIGSSDSVLDFWVEQGLGVCSWGFFSPFILLDLTLCPFPPYLNCFFYSYQCNFNVYTFLYVCSCVLPHLWCEVPCSFKSGLESLHLHCRLPACLWVFSSFLSCIFSNKETQHIVCM